MTLIKTYLQDLDVRTAWSHLMLHDSGFRLTGISTDENPAGGMVDINDSNAVTDLIAKNRSGFFLFSDRARFNVVARRDLPYITIMAEPREDEVSVTDIISIFRAATKNQLLFGFAADVKEYRHRNKYLRTIGGDHFEAWVGRDIVKHVPGLYWATAISDKVFPGFSESASTATEAATLTRISPDHSLVVAFESVKDWRSYAPEIDRWCDNEPKVFSLTRIRPELDAAENLQEVRRILKLWR